MDFPALAPALGSGSTPHLCVIDLNAASFKYQFSIGYFSCLFKAMDFSNPSFLCNI